MEQRMKRRQYRIQFRPEIGKGRWETVEKTHNEKEVWLMFVNYIAQLGEWRIVTTGDKQLAWYARR